MSLYRQSNNHHRHTNNRGTAYKYGISVSRYSANELANWIFGRVHRRVPVGRRQQGSTTSRGDYGSDRIARGSLLPRADNARRGRPGGKNNKIERVKTGSRSPGGPLYPKPRIIKITDAALQGQGGAQTAHYDRACFCAKSSSFLESKCAATSIRLA